MPRKPKLSKAEQVERDIRKWQRTQERALTMDRKAASLLKRSAVELARLHKKQAKLARELPSPAAALPAAHPTVTVDSESTGDSVPLEQLGETEVGRANRESWNATHPKRKRERKPKTEAVEPPVEVPAPVLQEREARMKAAGFRKTANRARS
jgi:hypothetical protein